MNHPSPQRKPLPLADRVRAAKTIWTGRLWEHVTYDSRFVAFVSAALAVIAAGVLSAFRSDARALKSLTAAHRATRSPLLRGIVERALAHSSSRRRSPRPWTIRACAAYLGDIPAAQAEQARRLFGSRALVLKSPRRNERGVIVIDYTYAFPLIARFFDIEAISRHYHIVLEPSWVGFCVPEILVYSRVREPVFVQTIEPPDARFLNAVGGPFVQVPVAGNWWVDHRTVRPMAISKDVDVCMVASWSRFKRHAAVFSAFRQLRRRGQRPTLLLIGYAGDRSLTRDAVFLQAKHYGIADQVEMHENLDLPDLVAQLNRAKVHVLWSRREGFNRAIIEAMAAGVPGILREGHNYGYRYPYINPQTGVFANEATLPDALASMVAQHSSFSPRQWILEHMTPEIATTVLARTIRSAALARGEEWTSDPVIKTVELTRMRYWDAADGQRFAADYEFVASHAREHS